MKEGTQIVVLILKDTGYINMGISRRGHFLPALRSQTQVSICSDAFLCIHNRRNISERTFLSMRLWSHGQNSWLHNGDVLCFLYELNLYMLLAVPGHALLWPFPVTD
jgi:hypothetical protein